MRGPASTSLVYRYLRKNFADENQLHFKVLAIYSTMPKEYLHLLESVLTILLPTCYDACTDNTSMPENRKSARTLVKGIHQRHAIPSLLWGLNMVWPLSQRCPHPMRSIPAPCANPACGLMTNPNETRYMLDYDDITKGFLCVHCYEWKLAHNNELPSEEEKDRYWAKKVAPMDRCEHCRNDHPNGSPSSLNFLFWKKFPLYT